MIVVTIIRSLIGWMLFRVGLFCMTQLFPWIMVKTGPDNHVEAIVFADSEAILRMYKTRSELNDEPD